MRPLSQWPLESRQRIVGVFTDIDDTLTTQQAITPDALQALTDLKAAGLAVIPITGRPVGWCQPHAQGDPVRGLPAWAVDALVAENGGVAFVPAQHPLQPVGLSACPQPFEARPFVTENLCHIGLQPPSHRRKQLSKIYYCADPASRSERQRRMQQVARQILQQVPGAALSQDSAGRETDIAIDYNEITRLAPEQVAQVVALFEAQGMHATVSSIHINGWFGEHNKWQAARWMLRTLFGRVLDDEIERWVYVGDSTNDQLMFAHFPHSIGVANIHHFAAQLTHWPRYVTASERGAGFAEVAQAILQTHAP